MNSKVRTVGIAIAALAMFVLGIAGPIAAASAPTAPCGGEITPPMLSDTVVAGSVTIQSWGFSWTGVTPSTSITITAVSSNAAWTVSVTNPVSSGPTGSGSTTLTVTITAPGTVGSTTQITVTSSNGGCAIASFASASEIITGSGFPPPVPQFPVPAVAVAGLGLIMLAVLRTKTSKGRLQA